MVVPALQSPGKTKWILIQVTVIWVGQSTFLAIEIIKLRTSYLGHCGLVFGGVSKRSGQLRVPSNDLINTKQLSESCLMGKRGQEAKKLLFILESESEVAQLCLTLCNPMGCSLPDSSIHGILQTRTLEWVAISLSKRSSQPRDRNKVSRLVGRRFTLWALFILRILQIHLLLLVIFPSSASRSHSFLEWNVAWWG